MNQDTSTLNDTRSEQETVTWNILETETLPPTVTDEDEPEGDPDEDESDEDEADEELSEEPLED